ncbi:MAG: helix-turn-helix transcriptional regulator [Bdellovibrio sp.]|nr:helix-turn-helix transcriptional regulator [Bdellovibrio sp.]
MAKNKRLTADVYSSKCPSREVLNHVTSTWGSLVLVLLLEQTYRFSELRNRIGGISEKMLAQTLQLLEKDGFIARKVYPVIPPKVEYSLTPLGKDVAEKVSALKLWVEANLTKVISHRSKNA